MDKSEQNTNIFPNKPLKKCLKFIGQFKRKLKAITE